MSSSSKWTCTDSNRDVRSLYKKSRRKNKISINEDLDNLALSPKESITRGWNYSWYNCNVSSRKIQRWLMSKIGQHVDTVFSDFIKDMKLYKIRDLNYAKEEFWTMFDNTSRNNWRRRVTGESFFLNPDKTIGYKPKTKPKLVKVIKNPKANWNNSTKPKGANLSKIIKESEIKGIYSLGKFYYISGDYSTKKPINISIVPREVWQDALTFDTVKAGQGSYPFSDKFYLKLIKEWIPVNIEGIGTGVDLLNNYEYTSRADNKYILIKKRFK